MHKGSWRQLIEEAEADERDYRKTIDLPIYSLEATARDYLLASVEKQRSKNRYDGLRYNLERWILPFFGARTHINAISSERVEQFIGLHKKRGVKNITIWHYVKDLRACFNWAIGKRRMLENPVNLADLDPIRNRKAIKPPLNMQAINKGINSLAGRDRLYVDVLRFMGLRKDEANHIQARDVFDYDEEMWLQVVYHQSDIKANRVVPVPPVLWQPFRDCLAKASPQEYLFGMRKGKPIYDRRKLFDKINAAAGIKVTPKDMRDYFTSICNDSVVAQQMLGHTTLNTTAIYTRQVRERMQKGVEFLGANSWGKSDVQ